MHLVKDHLVLHQSIQILRDIRIWPRDLSVTVSPVRAEEGNITASARTMVYGPNVRLNVHRDVTDQGMHELTAKVNLIELHTDSPYTTGPPAFNQSVTADLTKITNKKIETSTYYDPVYKVTRKRYKYEKEESLVENLNGTTNSEGEWIVRREFAYEEGVHYRVEFRVTDSRGRTASRTAYIYPRKEYSSSSGYSSRSYTSNDPFDIRLSLQDAISDDDKEPLRFAIGEQVTVVAEISGFNTTTKSPILFYRTQRGIDSVVARNNTIHTETFDQSFAPKRCI